jgi:hypothetical protein
MQHTRLVGFAFHAVYVLDFPIIRAYRTIGPTEGFEVFAGFFVVGKDKIWIRLYKSVMHCSRL